MTNKVIHLPRHASVRRRAHGVQSMQTPVFHGDVDTLVARLRPAQPVYILRPDRVEDTARHFRRVFEGRPMYAVKTNPHEAVIAALLRGGFDAFDVASLEEVRIVRRLSATATLYFMHPVKAPEAIRTAYNRYGVRAFVLDCEDELHKILRETDYAKDLTLFVRVALPKGAKSAIDFSSKFGASPEETAHLLALARPFAKTLGMSFHVGTQISAAQAYAKGVACAAGIMDVCGFRVDALDVGGGFPVPYPGQDDVPSLEECVAAITDAVAAHGLGDIPLLAEPGRYMVALAGSLIARVELRKRDILYINDGTYGGLFDAGAQLNQRFPVRAIRAGSAGVMGGAFSSGFPVPSSADFSGSFSPAFSGEAELQDFRFAGPTCDSLDMMDGPFCLPSDIAMGDWIEIQHAGAYSACTRTNFNGFGLSETVCLYDDAGAPSTLLMQPALNKGKTDHDHTAQKRRKITRKQPQGIAAE